MREKKTLGECRRVYLLCFTTDEQRLLLEPYHITQTSRLHNEALEIGRVSLHVFLSERENQPPARLSIKIQALSAWTARPQQYETRVHLLRNSHHYSICGPSALSYPPGASALTRADKRDKHCLAKVRLDWAQIGSW